MSKTLKKKFHESLEHYALYMKGQILQLNNHKKLYIHYIRGFDKFRKISENENSNIIIGICWELQKFNFLINFFNHICIYHEYILDDEEFADYVIKTHPIYVFDFTPRIYTNLDRLKLVIYRANLSQFIMNAPNTILENPIMIGLFFECATKYNKYLDRKILTYIPDAVFHDKDCALKLINLNWSLIYKIPSPIRDDDIILLLLEKHFIYSTKYICENIIRDIFIDRSFDTSYKIFVHMIYRRKLIAKMSRFAPDSHFRFQ